MPHDRVTAASPLDRLRWSGELPFRKIPCKIRVFVDMSGRGVETARRHRVYKEKCLRLPGTPMRTNRFLSCVLALALGYAVPATSQRPVESFLRTGAAVQALRALPAPALPQGIPPFFTLTFDSAGNLASAEPGFRQLPDAFTRPVLAILREHAIRQDPAGGAYSTYVRVVTGPHAQIDRPAIVGPTLPQLANRSEVARQLTRGAAELLTAREKSAGRRVRVRFIVNEDGTVDHDSVTVIGASGNRRVDSLAVAAVRAMRFRPSTVDNVPIRYPSSIPITVSSPASDQEKPAHDSTAGAAAAPATFPAALDGLSFSVGAEYLRVDALSDAHFAVFVSALAGIAVFVATVPPGMPRTEAMRRARTRAATAALGVDEPALDWFSIGSYPVSRHEVYHDRRVAHERELDLAAVVQLRRLAIGGREVITGYAFAADPQAAHEEVAFDRPSVSSAPAVREWARIAAAFGGTQPVDEALLTGSEPGTPLPAGVAADSAQAAVRTAWARSAHSASVNDPAAAVDLLARPYLEYIEDVRYLALHEPAAEVHAEPLITQVHILLLRHRVPAARLKEISARQLLGEVYGDSSLPARWSSRRDPADVERVIVDHDLAYVWGRRSGHPDVFRRENGAWKEDVLHHVFAWEVVPRMSTQPDSRGSRSRDDQMLYILRHGGRPLPRTVWDPPAQP